VYCPNRECPDFAEDGVPGEYVETVTVCPKCGAALVAEFPAWEGEDEPAAGAPEDEGCVTCPTEPLPRGLLVALAAFDYPDETEPLVAALGEAGIPVFQFLDDGRDFQDRGGVPTCTRLLVPDTQAAQALAILRRIEEAG